MQKIDDLINDVSFYINSQVEEKIKQWLTAAKGADFVALVEKIQLENHALKAELAALRAKPHRNPDPYTYYDEGKNRTHSCD